MSPRSGFEALMKEIRYKVKLKSLSFSSIWNITKKPNDPKKLKEDLRTSILKYVTDISEELVTEIFKQFPIATPTKEEFLAFFGEKEEIRKDKIINTKEEEKINEQTRAKWIAKYKVLLEQN